ncbi:uncharacterized protein TNCV_4470541 [Trichonephila clavipes]|uniref:Uncharacterized protein n=1 Tax=Trichonephila clavipes TaxID=2585209 RepID=A0A8X6SGK6_TRICX|nr:uncharacterized protein TNCV_4470541 [Trichonephila clavipes]
MRSSWSPKLKRDSSEKTTWYQSACQALCSSTNYESDISTPVVVDQRAANCLNDVVRSFTAMWSRCQLSRADVTSRRLLPVFQVVRCSTVHCFQTRITVELFRCTRAPIA